MQKKIMAIGLIVSGPVILVGTIVLFAITNFIVSAVGPDLVVLGTILNLVLSLAGILGLLLVIVGFPIGVIMLIMNLDEKKVEKKKK
jgi:hypothetical protein